MTNKIHEEHFNKNTKALNERLHKIEDLEFSVFEDLEFLGTMENDYGFSRAEAMEYLKIQRIHQFARSLVEILKK